MEEALTKADLLLCEDTRRTQKLLHALNLKKPKLSFHEHNERERLPRVLDYLKEGKTVVLVSDAGTPLISDPGYPLVRACRAEGIPVYAIPGPSAVTLALVLSGFPPYPFTFMGYPPPKKGKRQRFWERCFALNHTVVVFIPPHKLKNYLDELRILAPQVPLFLAKEMTKRHETHLWGTPEEVLLQLESVAVKGEWTLVLAPKRA